jgi:TRAP-type transport system periplasmic protein
MKRFDILIFAALLITGISGSASAQPIKFATLAPDGSTWMNMMQDFTNKVKQRTGGKVSFKIYPNMVAGDESGVLRKIRVNQFQGGAFTGNGLGQILPEVRVLELPYLFQSAEEIDAVYNEMFDYFADAFEKKNYILLGWTEVGWVYFFTNKPVKNSGDMKGVKMWVWEGDPLAEATFNAFNISAIPLPVTEVFTSLQTGLIDGVYASPLAAISTQWYTKVKYMSTIPMTNATGAILISKRVFSRISPANQKILRDEGRKFMKSLNAQTRVDNEISIAAMKKMQLQTIDPEAAGLQAFQDGGRKVYQDLNGKLYSSDLLTRVQSIITRVRNGSKVN